MVDLKDCWILPYLVSVARGRRFKKFDLRMKPSGDVSPFELCLTLAVTDQKSSPAYECDHSRNGSVHGSNVSPDLAVQGEAVQQILAAAPSRDHSVRVLALYRHIPLSHHSSFHTYTTSPPTPVNLARRTRIGNADLFSLSPFISNSLIATHYLLDISSFPYCPHTWDARDAWPSRMVFTLIRDAVQFERLMQICPPWFTARMYHFISRRTLLCHCRSR